MDLKSLEWAIDPSGEGNLGSPSPNSSYATLTPSRSTKPA